VPAPLSANAKGEMIFPPAPMAETVRRYSIWRIVPRVGFRRFRFARIGNNFRHESFAEVYICKKIDLPRLRGSDICPELMNVRFVIWYYVHQAKGNFVVLGSEI
jgi:hypothetical protein